MAVFRARLIPVIALPAMFVCAGCSTKNYELSQIEFSFGSGTMLPGVNLTTTYTKKDKSEVVPENEAEAPAEEGAAEGG